MSRTIVLALICALAAERASAADPPRVGGGWETIAITAGLPRFGTGRVHSFRLKAGGGARFRIEVQPLGGATLPSAIHVLVPNLRDSRFTIRHEDSGVAATHDFSMTRGIAGKEAEVRIIGYRLGKLRVRVSKLGAPAASGAAVLPAGGPGWKTIAITDALDRRGSGRVYKMRLGCKAGCRYRIEIQPLAGAELPTDIHVVVPNLKNGKFTVRHEASGVGATHDFSMVKGLPGHAFEVWIIGYRLGKLRVRLSKL